MTELLIGLLPYIVGTALLPVQVTIGLMLLMSARRGTAKAAAYLAGMSATRVLQGLLFGVVFVGWSTTEPAEAGSRRVVAATLSAVLGILLLTTALRRWREDEDPDAPPPGWIGRLDGLTPARGAGLGALVTLIDPKLWVFTLGALATVAAAGLGTLRSALAYALFIVLAQSLIAMPVLMRLLAPERSQALLQAMKRWLERNNRSIVILSSSLFGTLFLGIGLRALLR